MRRARGLRNAMCWICLGLFACTSKDAGAPSAPPPVAGADPQAPLPAVPGHATPLAQPPGLGLHSPPPSFRPEIVFSERPGGIAQVVEKEGRFQVVHNGRAGRRYAVVGEVALSPDGRRCAYGAIVDGRWRMVVDGKEGRPFDTVRAPVFSPDGAHLAYQGMAGELWHLVVDSTVNRGTRTRYLNHEFSAGSSRIAFVEDVDDRERGRLMVSDLAFKTPMVVASDVSVMVVNAGRSRLAAVVASGAQQSVVTLAFDAPEGMVKGPAFDSVSDPTFGPDGASVAYVASRSGRSLLVLDGREVPIGSGHAIGPPAIIPGRNRVGALIASASGSIALQEFFAENAPAGPPYDQAEGLVYAGDGRSHAYAAGRGASWHVVVNGKEGPPFDRVVSPVFSPDGRLVAYRARKEGKRFVVVADSSGGSVSLHPSYEQVFPVQFAVDGRSVAYGVKDGPEVAWKVEGP